MHLESDKNAEGGIYRQRWQARSYIMARLLPTKADVTRLVGLRQGSSQYVSKRRRTEQEQYFHQVLSMMVNPAVLMVV